jgi:hypothetical protein
MVIEMEVVGGTGKHVRVGLDISGDRVGELLIERADFTRFAELLFEGNYKLTKHQCLKKEI